MNFIGLVSQTTARFGGLAASIQAQIHHNEAWLQPHWRSWWNFPYIYLANTFGTHFQWIMTWSCDVQRFSYLRTELQATASAADSATQWIPRLTGWTCSADICWSRLGKVSSFPSPTLPTGKHFHMHWLRFRSWLGFASAWSAFFKSGANGPSPRSFGDRPHVLFCVQVTNLVWRTHEGLILQC